VRKCPDQDRNQRDHEAAGTVSVVRSIIRLPSGHSP
jgi:hypothetical protein